MVRLITCAVLFLLNLNTGLCCEETMTQNELNCIQNCNQLVNENLKYLSLTVDQQI